MSTIFVSSGVTSADVTVSGGVTLEVLSGGRADNTTVLNGGVMSLASGADAEGLTISTGGRLTGVGEVDGAVTVAGEISGVTLRDTGSATVESGGAAVGVTDDAANLAISRGATETGVIVEVSNDFANEIFGVASDTIVRSAGQEIVESGGLAVDDMVSSGGSDFVGSGGAVSGAVVGAGGELWIQQGGSAAGATLESGGAFDFAITVQSGQKLSVGPVAATTTLLGVTAFSGGVFNAYQATVRSGGTLTLVSGARESGDVTVSAGGVLSGPGEISADALVAGRVEGVALGDLSGDSAGYLEVESGGSASGVRMFGHVFFQGAGLVIDAGATATNTVVGGAADVGWPAYDNVYGVATGTSVGHAGEETVIYGGAEVGGVVLSGGVLRVFSASISDERVSSGGSADVSFTVSSGQNVRIGVLTSTEITGGLTASSGAELNADSAAVLAGGTLTVSSDSGSELATDVNVYAGGRMDELPGAITDYARIHSGGLLTLSSGAVANAVTVEAGGALSGAGALGPAPGPYDISRDGGRVDRVTLDSGCDLLVESGGETSGLSNFGIERLASGSLDSGTTVQSGGAELVLSGGRTDGVTLGGGAKEDVYAGAAATGTTVSGAGVAYVFGVASGGVVSDAGQQIVRSGGVAIGVTLALGGVAYVSSGGAASGTVVSSGGADAVLASGGVSRTVVSFGGREDVKSGGFASGTTVESGAFQLVWSGGVADTTRLSGGKLDIDAGGLARATTVSSGGLEFIFSGGVAFGETVSSGGVEAISSGGATSGLALLSGGIVIDNGKVRNTGSGTLAGTLSGSGYVVETTSGVLLLSGNGAAFDGQAVIEGGTIELAKAGALGGGSVDFVAPATGSAVLQIDAADAPAAGGTFANVISNFSAAGEDIDLRSIAYVSGASATVIGGVLVLTDGGEAYRFDLADSIAGAYPVLSDGHGGTLIDPEAARFAQTAAAFAPSDAAKTALVSSAAPAVQTPFAHASAVRP